MEVVQARQVCNLFFSVAIAYLYQVTYLTIMLCGGIMKNRGEHI